MNTPTPTDPQASETNCAGNAARSDIKAASPLPGSQQPGVIAALAERLLGHGTPVDKVPEMEHVLLTYPQLFTFVKRCAAWLDMPETDRPAAEERHDACDSAPESHNAQGPRATAPLCILVTEPDSLFADVIYSADEARGRMSRLTIWLRPPTEYEVEVVDACARQAEGIGGMVAQLNPSMPDVIRAIQLDYQKRYEKMTPKRVRRLIVPADALSDPGRSDPSKGQLGGLGPNAYVLLKIKLDECISQQAFKEWLKVAVNEFEKHGATADTVVVATLNPYLPVVQEAAHNFPDDAGVPNGRCTHLPMLENDGIYVFIAHVGDPHNPAAPSFHPSLRGILETDQEIMLFKPHNTRRTRDNQPIGEVSRAEAFAAGAALQGGVMMSGNGAAGMTERDVPPVQAFGHSIPPEVLIFAEQTARHLVSIDDDAERGKQLHEIESSDIFMHALVRAALHELRSAARSKVLGKLRDQMPSARTAQEAVKAAV